MIKQPPQIRDAICRKTFECHLLKIQALSADQLFKELPKLTENEPDGAPADLPEGDGGVCGGDVPPVDHLGLPQPLVRLGQRDLAAVRAGFPEPGKKKELVVEVGELPPHRPW